MKRSSNDRPKLPEQNISQSGGSESNNYERDRFYRQNERETQAKSKLGDLDSTKLQRLYDFVSTRKLDISNKIYEIMNFKAMNLKKQVHYIDFIYKCTKEVIEGVQPHNHQACWQVREFLDNFNTVTETSWMDMIPPEKVRRDNEQYYR